jgi:quercetin dioxygenase-like cupin family protein
MNDGGTLDRMITPGTTLKNPVTGERFSFIETAASTDGERLTFDLALRPGGAVPLPHVHPIQTERFEMLGGTMRFRVGLRHVTATAGDVVEIEPGVVHGFANAGDDAVRVRVTCTPALRMEEMFPEVVAMAEAGRMGKRGMPRNLLDLALLARTYDSEAHAPVLGRRLQRILLAPLVKLARRRAGRPALRRVDARLRLGRATP